MIQQPVRARACGFGDKVSGTFCLTPCAMVAYHGTGPSSLVSASDHPPLDPKGEWRLGGSKVSFMPFGSVLSLTSRLVNNHFLILTVDLWASDRRSQRNVVMHPAAGNSRDDTSSYGPSHDSQYTESGSSSRPLTATARPDSGWSQKGWGEHSGRPTC